MMKTLITLLAVLAGTLLPAKNESETLLASWTLKDEVLRSVNGESWPRKGLAFADKGNTKACFFFHSDKGGSKCVISKDLNGHYAVIPVHEGDYFEFSIPVKKMKAGTAIAIRMSLRGLVTCAKYYALEYFDGADWVMTSAEELDGKATVALEKANEPLDIREDFTLPSDIAKGELRFRLRVAADISLKGEPLGKGAVLRLCQSSDGLYDTIGVYQLNY